MASSAPIPVVYDINVFMDHIRSGANLRLPDELPTDHPSSDALSLVFDGRVRLFTSPHILQNVDRLMRLDEQSEKLRRRFVEFIAEAAADSGGAVVSPGVTDFAIGDYEDNHILSLAKSDLVNADVIVSSDRHLLDLGPAWNGRLVMRPGRLVGRVLGTDRQREVAEPRTAPARPTPADRFPELRGLQLDRHGFNESLEHSDDELQR